MQDSGSGRPGGLFASLKAAAATLLAILHTRFELFSTELEEGWIRLAGVLIWVLAAVFCAGLGIGFAGLLLALLLWDTSPWIALATPMILFFLAAGLACRVAIRKLRSKPRFFAASLAELEKDRDRFIPRS
jgi:uncharacterized membrane protein YqjE